MLLSLLFVPAAFAGCESDNECKGDRVCESGRCTDPVSKPASRSKKKSKEGESYLSASKRLSTTGVVLTSVGLGVGAIGVGGGFLGWYSPTPELIGGVGLVGIAVGGPISAAAGSKARLGLLVLNPEPELPPGGPRVGGWVLYSTSLLLGGTAIVGGLSAMDTDAASAIGLGAIVTGSVGNVLFAVDARSAQNLLNEEIEWVSVAPAPVTTPFLAATGEGLLVGVQGTF